MTEREVLQEIVCKVGVLTYGKERWFKQNGCWYDRMNGDYIQNETLAERICKELEAEIEDEPRIVKKYDTFCGVPMAEAIEVMQKYTASKTEPQTDCSWGAPDGEI